MDSLDWGNDSPEGRSYRRHVTDKYGYISFGLAIALMALIVFCNGILGPVFFTMVNEKPTEGRKLLLRTPWLRISMWTLTLGILVASVAETNRLNLIYLAKRLGRVSLALMPPLYLLIMRPSLLPRSLYLQLVPIHKFLSRVVVIASVIHGVLYGVIYYQKDSLNKLSKTPNVLGILALVVFVAMALSAFARWRRRFFELFYQIHVLGAWISLPMLRWHSRPRSDAYLGMCAGILAFQVIAKLWMTCTTRLRVQYISSTLLLIEIPKSQLSPRRFWAWPVASHVRLSRSIANPLNWVRSSHPYTIASLPDDNSLKLVVRPGDFKLKMRRDYSVFGPHDCIPNYVMHQIHSFLVRRVLFVIGGAGIAFGAPMLRYVRMHGADVRMLWVMRDPYDARVLPQLGLHEEVLRGNIEIYYTGESIVQSDKEADDYAVEDSTLTIDMSDDCCNENNDGMRTIRSATRHPGVASRRVRKDPLLSQYALYMANSRPHLNLRLKSWLYGYPLDTMDCCCADRAIDACAEDKLGAWVMSCGNEQLSSTAEKWSNEAGVCYFQDSFTL